MKILNKYKEYCFIVLFLAGIFFGVAYNPDLPTYNGLFNTIDGSLYFILAIYTIVHILSFSIVCFVLVPSYLDTRKIVLFIISSLLLIVLQYGILEISKNIVSDFFGFRDVHTINPEIYKDTIRIHILTATNSIGIYIVSVFYGLGRIWLIKSKQQQQLEKEKLEAELKALKLQINPHFLFNALNNIYAITIRNNEARTGKAILELSNIMRYVIYDADTAKISIKQELDQIESYLSIVRLKYSDDKMPEINFNRIRIYEEYLVTPLLLMPFVENASKHGLSVDKKSYIEINSEIRDGKLKFSVINSNNSSKSELKDTKGIGLNNVKRRLELLYKDKYTLNIDANENEYSIKLVIELENKND